ncbi:preprotein translocase subunit SecG [Longibacter salinarum]|uniref:Protein-export membrane protein SecG n=1 Tax=Longibacter salinarum TaxID=1850348 RepID=A0A2A8D0V6_9BACT|nr:preprotein translocase subunit SecG [Longibacter salinarum]PEN14556.1 preprotein translocase subunit SecG [Longibacter salinarum]
MFTALVVFIAIIGVIMTGVILMQSGQGGGLAGIASGGATRDVLGSRRAPDLLERGTWILAGIFIALCILSNFAIGEEEREPVIPSSTQQAPGNNSQGLSPSGGEGAMNGNALPGDNSGGGGTDNSGGN